ncbi:MAG: class II aldolase/adducin family protein [Deltaproteobacteria bacterium]|nr:MAG: class II aldolase/adducin family protein [Deltaproteobacteria bacterium]
MEKDMGIKATHPANSVSGKKDDPKRQTPLVSKEDFCLFCRLLYDRHLVTGVGGNVSVRVGDKIFITPSGFSLRGLRPDMVVTVDEEGRVLEGDIPTKDVGVHLGILGIRPDTNVVCHVHGAFIIAASALMDPGPDALPPLAPGFAYFAHPLTMIAFMVPGTKEFAKATIEQFSNSTCRALLLQNHGLVTVGGNFEEALNIAEEIDEAARIYLLTNGRAQAISVENVRKIKKSTSSP